MRFPFALGWSPSPASITPALTSSSLNLPISANSASLGRAPASLFFVAFTITMTFMFVSLSLSAPRRRRGVHRGDE